MLIPSLMVSLIAALLLPCLVRAGDNDQIQFLHLKLKDGAVSMVGSSVRPGRLKSANEPDKQGELHLDLVATNGASLWSGVLADPLIRHYEYEDPESPGALKIKTVQLTEAEFTVRVPFHKDAAHLRIVRTGKPASRSAVLAAPALKKWSGTIALPGTGAVP